jgi:hypothetical protein
VTVDRDLDPDGTGGRIATRQVHHHAVDCLAGHLLGGVHGVQDRGLGLFHVHDHAATQAPTGLLADADDIGSGVAVVTRDEATDLAAPHIKARGQAVSAQPFFHIVFHFLATGRHAPGGAATV